MLHSHARYACSRLFGVRWERESFTLGALKGRPGTRSVVVDGRIRLIDVENRPIDQEIVLPTLLKFLRLLPSPQMMRGKHLRCPRRALCLPVTPLAP